LTILQAPLDIDILILEMGANHQGEIDTLCQIGQPNYGIITNIGKAHLEGFGGIEGVKKGKSELYKFLAEKKEGKIFINTDDSILLNLIPKSVSQIEYSILADFKHIVSKPTLNFEYKSIHIKTQLFGDYNIHNIACAISVGRYFDIDLLQCISAIEEYIPDNNRSQKIVKNNTTYILDAYNANPSSMEVSITNFSQIEGKKAVILGDMLELGDTTDLEHITILELIKKLKIQDAFLVGPNFYKHRELFNFYFFENVENFKPSFETLDLENTTVLLKGSRGIAIERLIQ
jgi:UDP-N-acetylmuramoyl-tripeptide--D-alanyl-D-alanine ligase